jgi:hypothetical protein
MNWRFSIAIICLLSFICVARSGWSQSIERGKLKAIDVPGKSITVTAGAQDRTLQLTEETRVLNARGSSLAERLTGFQPGVEIFFQAVKRDGKDVALGLKLVEPGERGPREAIGRGGGTRVSPDHSKLLPLTDLAEGKYGDFRGGLYPEGKNQRPRSHEEAGLRLAAEIVPVDAQGKPDPAGKIVLLSIGMSNTSQVSRGFRQELEQFDQRNSSLVFVDGAQGGMTADSIDDDEDGGRGQEYWRVVDDRLRAAGVTRQQVRATWIKQADAGPRQGFPGYARKLESELQSIVQIIARRFPQARLCYLSSRTYGGYATSSLNPEPYAYESGFSVKWLIEKQLAGAAELNYDPDRGPIRAPWLSWGPYLWANGATPRADGFSYQPTDFAQDGTHHAEAGSRKVGRLLLDFFRTDSTSRNWFIR